MLERIKRFFSRAADDPNDEPPETWGDRDAGIPVPVRPRPPDHGSSVAVAEPDEDE